MGDIVTMGSFLQREGWRDKYRIVKIDGSPIDPEAIYFPLRLDTDPYAREAARFYADRIEAKNPKLAADIREKVKEGEETHMRRSGYLEG